MAITTHEIENKTKRQALDENTLDDMGFEETEHGSEVRNAAKQYYMA